MKNMIIKKQFVQLGTKMLFVLILALLSQNLFSQSYINLASYDKQADKSMSSGEIKRVKSMYYDIHPTYSFSSENKYNSQDMPLVGVVNQRDFDKLYAKNEMFENIQMLIIEFDASQKFTPLYLSSLKSFENLEYILVKANQFTDVNNFNSLIITDNKREIKFFYIIENAE